MARIRKLIVSEGPYRLGNGRVAVVSKERIDHWAKSFSDYRSAGNLLPAPWAHLDPSTGEPIVMGPHLERSDINAGFWDKLESIYVTDINPATGKPYGQSLVGEVDVPDEQASKIGTTVRETSIYADDFIDGKGNAYHDTPLHIALVTHAIQPGQPNFEPAIAMSQFMASPPFAKPKGKTPTSTTPKKPSSNPASAGSVGSNNGAASPAKPGMTTDPSRSADDDNSESLEDGVQEQAEQIPESATNPDIGQVLTSLQDCGIILPQDTTPQNIFERLIVACAQKAHSESDEDEGSVYQPPQSGQVKSPAPVAMSKTPATPGTPAAPQLDAAGIQQLFLALPRETFMAHPAAKELSDTNTILLNALNATARSARKARIDALVSSGRIDQETADILLTPLLEGFAMSFTPEGQPKPHAIDAAIEKLEKRQPAHAVPSAGRMSMVQALLGNSPALAMSHNPPNPLVQVTGTTPEGGAGGQPMTTNQVLDTFFGNTGGPISH